jgi:hypothetical protein
LHDDLVMNHSTAMCWLTDVVDALDRAAGWPDTTVTAAFVFGTLLDGTEDLDQIDLALVAAEAPENVPWMSRAARLEALASVLKRRRAQTSSAASVAALKQRHPCTGCTYLPTE